MTYPAIRYSQWLRSWAAAPIRGGNDSTYTEIEKVSGDSKKFEFNYTADLLSGDRHYFKVAAISEDGDSAYSYPYYHFSLDQEPPGVPTNLEGIIDSNGVARLTWVAPEDKDLLAA